MKRDPIECRYRADDQHSAPAEPVTTSVDQHLHLHSSFYIYIRISKIVCIRTVSYGLVQEPRNIFGKKKNK